MAISGIGSSYGVAAGALVGGVSASRAASAAQPPSDGSGGALDFLVNYLKESPAKRMEEAWLAKHHLTEQQLAAMPPDQQKAIRKEMEDDIKRKLQEKSGAPGANANVVV